MAYQAKTSKALPIGLLIAGVIFIAINFVAESFTQYYLPKLLIGGFTLTILGVVMLIFPPADPHNPDQKNDLLVIIKHSKTLHVIAWVVGLIAGISCGFWYVLSNNYPL